ncbi:MAG: tRNA (N(6)-L-threonylcarbamoyladenosine(37)-C(2))-methylthiotransferase MtaB [Firmicutes bacterium]|nr:tRNA (N(6)-L-threonylcarbamoyladenosine(37)-C(2))-methylthiotransferase MtaB [Bacillota bacterium]
MAKTVAFYTLGCKVNQAEGESMKRLFRDRNYKVVDFKEAANVVIINTCTVTHLAARKSRQAIRQARRLNPKAVVAVVGCYSQTAQEKIAAIPGVDLILGTQGRRDIVNLVEEAAQGECLINVVGDINTAGEFEELPYEFSRRTRAFLKIQDGCDQYCTYCIIPYARGPIKSLPPAKVREAAVAYVKKGYKELVLTGIHLGLYGSDLVGEVDLAQMVQELAEIPGLERIRLGSLEATEISRKLLEVMGANPKVCPHLHIPLQSGSAQILARMNRPYTPEEFSQRVQRARRLLPGLGITTDIMVGFPGETREDFAATYKLVQDLQFSRLHVFPYSPRRGTPAAKYASQVSPRSKRQRAQELEQLGQQLARKFHREHLGQTLPVLIEHDRDGATNLLTGYTGNYMRVILPGADMLKGQLVPVTITEAQDEVCRGEYSPQI